MISLIQFMRINPLLINLKHIKHFAYTPYTSVYACKANTYGAHIDEELVGMMNVLTSLRSGSITSAPMSFGAATAVLVNRGRALMFRTRRMASRRRIRTIALVKRIVVYEVPTLNWFCNHHGRNH